MLKFLLNFIPGIGPFLSAASGIFSSVFGFVLQHWKFFTIAAMVGTIVYQNEAKTRFVFGLNTIPYLQVQVVSLKKDLAQAVDANQKLTTSIGALNTTVGEWEAKTAALQKQNDALQSKLNQMRTDTNKKVQDILNGKTPTTCEASIDFLRQEKGGLTW